MLSHQSSLDYATTARKGLGDTTAVAVMLCLPMHETRSAMWRGMHYKVQKEEERVKSPLHIKSSKLSGI
jgi:hypothetical protein